MSVPNNICLGDVSVNESHNCQCCWMAVAGTRAAIPSQRVLSFHFFVTVMPFCYCDGHFVNRYSYLQATHESKELVCHFGGRMPVVLTGMWDENIIFPHPSHDPGQEVTLENAP